MFGWIKKWFAPATPGISTKELESQNNEARIPAAAVPSNNDISKAKEQTTNTELLNVGAPMAPAPVLLIDTPVVYQDYVFPSRASTEGKGTLVTELPKGEDLVIAVEIPVKKPKPKKPKTTRKKK